MREKYTVVIAEDHTILREGLKAILNASGEFNVIGEAKDGMAAIRRIKDKKPDIALLDLSMPKMGGISVIMEITRTVPKTKILALTMHAEEEYVLEAFKAGAKGYCLKTTSQAELLIAIRSVLSGNIYASPEVSEHIVQGFLDSKNRYKAKSSWDTLTQREIEVLKLVGEGFRNKAISDFLCISIKTVEKHRANIMQKLDLHSASALTAYAISKGLVVK